MISDTYIPFISYSDISPWILSRFLSYQSLIITFFYLTHPTVTHDLTLISIRRRRGSVLDHFGCAFIYLSDFRFNIFHDGRAWQIADLLVMMLSFCTQTFHPGCSHAFHHTRAWSSPYFILHIPPWHMTSPLSRLGGDVDQSSIILVVLSYIF